MTLLEAVGISKRFGGVAALMPVSLAIEEGEFVGLVGQNGAGKTTLFNCLLGIDHPDTGTISFRGRRIDHQPTYRRVRLGIGRTFQRVELFAGMTPREHFVPCGTHAREEGSRAYPPLVDRPPDGARKKDGGVDVGTRRAHGRSGRAGRGSQPRPRSSRRARPGADRRTEPVDARRTLVRSRC